MEFIIYVKNYGEYDRISGDTYEEALNNFGYNSWDVDCVREEIVE